VSLPPIIRPESREDFLGIRRVLTEAFPTPDEANLVEELRAAHALPISLVAIQSGAVVGHIAFSPVTLAPPITQSLILGLAPLAVAPAAQRQGLGSELVRAGLRACQDTGVAGVFVLGSPEYYTRFGFRPASEHNLRCLFDAPPEAFQFVAWQDLPSPAIVHFHSAFDRWLPANT
jgi:putative acetyltransferase